MHATALQPAPPHQVAKHAVRVARDGVGPYSQGWGTVLDPSAGDGAIADQVAALTPDATLITIEPDPTQAQLLIDRGHRTVVCTFESYAAAAHAARAQVYDAIVMTPPWVTRTDRMAWLTHLELAVGLLAPNGRLVAVVPHEVEHRTGARFAAIRQVVCDHGWTEPMSTGARGEEHVTSLVVVDAPAKGRITLPPAPR
jgi:predicted RNA methylase